MIGFILLLLLLQWLLMVHTAYAVDDIDRNGYRYNPSLAGCLLHAPAQIGVKSWTNNNNIYGWLGDDLEMFVGPPFNQQCRYCWLL